MPSPAVTRGAKKRRAMNRPTSGAQRFLQLVLLLASLTLGANAVVGERGFIELIENRRQHIALTREISSLRHENSNLHLIVLRLTRDPSAIEEVARKDLGLILPGEQLFLLNDYVDPAR